MNDIRHEEQQLAADSQARYDVVLVNHSNRVEIMKAIMKVSREINFDPDELAIMQQAIEEAFA